MSEILFELKLKKLKKKGERYKQLKKIENDYADYIPKYKAKKKKKVSNIVLAVVIIAVLAYTIASFWLTYVRGVSVDPTLTTCFYTFFGSELCMLAGIKLGKTIKGEDKHDGES